MEFSKVDTLIASTTKASEITHSKQARKCLEEKLRILNELKPVVSLSKAQSTLALPIYVSQIRQAAQARTPAFLSSKALIGREEIEFTFLSGRLGHLKNALADKGGKIDLLDYLSELVPHSGRQLGLVTYQNGIMNTPDDFQTMGKLIAKHFPEHPLCIGLYNPILNILAHTERLKLHFREQITPVVVRTYIFFKRLMDHLLAINPNLVWVHVMHSEGGAIGHLALKGFSRKEILPFKHNLITAAYGPVMPIPFHLALRTYNSYSKKDTAASLFLDIYFRGKQGYKIDELDCITPEYVKSANGSLERRLDALVSDGSSNLIGDVLLPGDHAFKGETYQKALFENMRSIRQDFLRGRL